jgi:N-acylneuraminate cytidylyltransferase
MQAMKNIAIIPARGGSKRIPNKNIKDFLGKPILAYSIETALESGLFDEVMVSTDSKEIAEVAQKYGAKVPFFRTDKTADDFATTAEVLTEVIMRYELKGITIENACCVYPTAVLLSTEQLILAHQNFEKWSYDSLMSVLKFSYPVQRGLREESGKLKMVWPENKTKRSQDLETIFHDAGQFYFFKVDRFKEKQELFTENTGYLLLSEYEAQDIDNPEDWTMAELKYKFLKGK